MTLRGSAAEALRSRDTVDKVDSDQFFNRGDAAASTGMIKWTVSLTAS